MYRIFERNKGDLKTLFHGVNGSRTIRPGVWHKARSCRVRDGSGGTYYMSGFHVLPSREDAEAFLSRFRRERDLVVTKVLVRGGVRRKEHSPAPVFLADELMVPGAA